MQHFIPIRPIALRLLVGFTLFSQSCRAQGQPAAIPSLNRPMSEGPADAAQIKRLIRQLGSAQFADREAASKALEAIGEPALPALREAQKSKDAEVRRRALILVKAFEEVIRIKRAPARAKAWASVQKLGGQINSDDGTPDGRIGGVDLCCRRTILDADVAVLHWLDDARSVRLDGTAITDAGLVHLKHLYRVQILDIGSTKITDGGLEHIGRLTTLRSLAIYDTPVTDAGLVHLKRLNKLVNLWLSDTQITDRGLDQIKELKGLINLHLDRTQVTDAGLAKLKELQELQSLFLEGTKVTDKGIADLRKALPKLKHIRR